ncbi:hypothetical protein FQR65_LT02550 [Abscondita terminalis]|nr:hypothetical protein FQR65_LT02550 [Abscondita terminalis]
MNTTSSVVKIPPITMSKLYIGNLPTDTNEMILRQLFLEQNLPCTNILVKRGGYAFVDCPDQSSADKAIDKLNVKLWIPAGFRYRRQVFMVGKWPWNDIIIAIKELI